MEKSNNDELKRLEKQLSQNMARIRSKILVLSNKGGVGKSSVSVNTAVSLSLSGKKTGLLDADIHGPSVAKLLGFEGEKLISSTGGFLPFRVKANLHAVSMASVMENADTPVIWRGPLKMSVLRQFLAEVAWGDLDFMIIDSPPGTGDEPLSICQLTGKLDGAIIVTTPQDVALLDSRKCVKFLEQLKVPVIGILENMSGFTCPHCGKQSNPFKTGGGEISARELGVPFLGKLPLDTRIMEASDSGTAFIEKYPEDASSDVINRICRSLPGF